MNAPLRDSAIRLSADVGGTFTDVAAFDEATGALRLGKTLTTPQRLVTGIENGVVKADSQFAAARYNVNGSLDTTFGTSGYVVTAYADGRSQARSVAAELGDSDFSGLFVSTLRRTQETAAPLVERTGLDVRVLPDLREVFLGELEGGEGVDVDVGVGGPDGAGDVDVVVAVEVGVDAALEADLGGAQLGRFPHPAGDVVEGQQVGRAPQVE